MRWHVLRAVVRNEDWPQHHPLLLYLHRSLVVRFINIIGYRQLNRNKLEWTRTITVVVLVIVVGRFQSLSETINSPRNILKVVSSLVDGLTDEVVSGFLCPRRDLRWDDVAVLLLGTADSVQTVRTNWNWKHSSQTMLAAIYFLCKRDFGLGHRRGLYWDVHYTL